MPELHSYPVDFSNELADYQLGDKYETPLDTGLAAHLSRGFNVGPSSIYNAFGVGLEDSAMFKGYEADGTPIPNEWIDSKTAKSRYGISINSGQKISDLSAQRIAQFKAADEERNAKINRMSTDFGTQALGFGAEMLGSLLDPISIGASFIPFVGEARGLMLMERFGPTAGRLLIGGIEGALGNAILEPLTYGAAKTLNYEYDAFDSFMNIAAGGIIGAGFHAGFGKVADIFGVSTWSKQLEAGRIDPETHHNMLRTTIGELLEDKKVKIDPIYKDYIVSKLDELGPEFKTKVNLLYGKNIPITKDEIEAITSYVETSYELNVFLREGLEGSSHLSNLEIMDKLDSAINKSILNEDTKLYRGASLFPDEFNNIREALNNKLKDRAFLSTTLDKNIAEEFKFHGYEGLDERSLEELLDEVVPILYEIDVPKGHRGLRVDELVPQFSLQKEVILPRETELFIKSIEQDGNGHYLVKAEALDDIAKLEKDISNLQISPNQLVEELENYHTIQGKWYYEPEISRQIEENVKAAPKNYDDVDAQKQLDDIMGTIDNLKRAEAVSESELEQLDLYDENIKKSESFGNALKSAANCVIKGFI